MRNDEAPPAVRVAAANVILDRGYGKPKETVDANVRTSWEDLVLASMGRRREQPTQSSRRSLTSRQQSRNPKKWAKPNCRARLAACRT